ncbi:MAG: outer membrane protein assembly factor BamD [Crocinitomicaceae bacterium]|nr:outer membrane protein assembly factor BamD [Crocinitomicaceae bacterium]
MKKPFLFFFAILSLAFCFVSCSEYSKVLKEKDVNIKYSKAVAYYENGECYKALPIFEELLGVTRGTLLAENVYYYYAKTEYCIKDYYLANYYFKTFSKTFAASPKAEECLFLAALCSYRLSPEYSLDHQDTKMAIDQFQLFLDQYPASTLRDSANFMITRLNDKLEVKSFEIAKLYYTTGKYKAATNAFHHILQSYPDTRFRPEILYLTVKSAFLYAEGSISSRKLERYRAATESYVTFASAYPNSPLLKEAESYYEKSRKAIEKLTETKSKKNE